MLKWKEQFIPLLPLNIGVPHGIQGQELNFGLKRGIEIKNRKYCVCVCVCVQVRVRYVSFSPALCLFALIFVIPSSQLLSVHQLHSCLVSVRNICCTVADSG